MAEILQKIGGLHMGFLWQVTGMKSLMLGGKTWKKYGSDRLLKAAGTKPLREYINNRQDMVAEWVALRQIFEVCAKETGYEVGGRLR